MSHPGVIPSGRAGVASDSRWLLAAAALLGAACGSLARLSWLVTLGAVAILSLVALGLRWPMFSWYLMTGSLLFIDHYVPPWLGPLLIWVVVAIFLIACWLDEGEAPPLGRAERRLRLWMIGWLMLSAVSALQAINGLASVKEIGRDLISFAVLLTYFRWMRSRGQIERMARWWERTTVGSAAILLVIGLQRPGEVEGSLRLLGLSRSAMSDLGVVLAALIPVSLSLLYVPQRGGRWVRVAGLLVAAWALILTGSRSAWLAAVVGLLLAAAWSSRRLARPALVVAGVVAVGLGACLWLRYGSLAEGVRVHLSGRDLLWAAGLRAIKEGPWLGLGPGCWATWLTRTYVSADFLIHDELGNFHVLRPALLGGEAHNLFLTKTAEMGVLAGAWLMVLLWGWAREVRRVGWWRHPDPFLRALAIGSVASMCGLWIRCLFENGPIIGRARGGEIIVVWFIAVLPFAIARAALRGARPEPGPPRMET